MRASKLTPTRSEIEELRFSLPPGPVVIINLLKFKPGQRAREAYARYMQGAAAASHPDMEVIHAGKCALDMGAGEDWDYSIIARYRNFEDFVSVVEHPAWQAADKHRAEALERTVFIASPVEELGSGLVGE